MTTPVPPIVTVPTKSLAALPNVIAELPALRVVAPLTDIGLTEEIAPPPAVIERLPVRFEGFADSVAAELSKIRVRFCRAAGRQQTEASL